jgi:hypothetical protein
MSYRGLFEPDVLIAEQSDAARRRGAALSSEKRLMLAVLQNAVDCYQKYVLADDRLGRELFEEAAKWIESTRNDSLFSFETSARRCRSNPAISAAAWPSGTSARST